MQVRWLLCCSQRCCVLSQNYSLTHTHTVCIQMMLLWAPWRCDVAGGGGPQRQSRSACVRRAPQNHNDLELKPYVRVCLLSLCTRIRRTQSSVGVCACVSTQVVQFLAHCRANYAAQLFACQVHVFLECVFGVELGTRLLINRGAPQSASDNLAAPSQRVFVHVSFDCLSNQYHNIMLD